MLAISRPVDYGMGESVEEACYAELQPVTMDTSCFITSSTDPCLTEFLEDVSCVECVVQSQDLLTTDHLQDCSIYILPDSPQSLDIEDDCSIPEEDLLQTDLYEESAVYDEDDDDASVMLDFMDLSFLDEPEDCLASGEEERQRREGGYGHSFMDSLDSCPTVIVKANPGSSLIPDFNRFDPSAFPPTPTPSPSSSPTHTSTPTLPLSPPYSPNPAFTMTPSPTSATPPSTTPHYIINASYSTSSSDSTIIPTPPPPRTTATTTMKFHYCDLPTTVVTITDPSEEIVCPPSPPDSTTGSPVSVEVVSTQTHYSPAARKRKMDKEGERNEKKVWNKSAMDFDSFDNSDNDDGDDDPGYKPYCDSRRGAKKNLLWKFLLWTLDNHSDVVSWTDVQKGIFKFVDTTRVSTLWGERKNKTDMTFEKLSRGIRHYYKRGLMQRLSHTRLMYKFNWEKVPRRYRKA